MSHELHAALDTTPTLLFYIHWIPGQAVIPGNEKAHLFCRVTSILGPVFDRPKINEPQLQRTENHQKRADKLRQLHKTRFTLVTPPLTL